MPLELSIGNASYLGRPAAAGMPVYVKYPAACSLFEAGARFAALKLYMIMSTPCINLEVRCSCELLSLTYTVAGTNGT